MCFVFSDQPDTPTLVSDNNDPTDGDYITLTCNTTTTGITSYLFKRDQTLVANTTVNTHKIAHATLGTYEGQYTCVAFIDTVPSIVSNVIAISCEYTGNINVCFFLMYCFMLNNCLFYCVELYKGMSSVFSK